MANLLGLRRKTRSDRDRDRATHIEAVVRGLLNLDDNAIVRVLAAHCADPACGQVAILVARPNAPTRAVGIDKPLEAISEADLRTAVRTLT